MGFMRWLRGGDDNTAATSVVSAGLAEIDGLFRPSKHKQTEHVEESKRRRIDVANGADIDLERGIVVVRSTGADGPDGASPDGIAPDATGRPVRTRTRTIYQPRRRGFWARLSRRVRRRRPAARRDGQAGPRVGISTGPTSGRDAA